MTAHIIKSRRELRRKKSKKKKPSGSRILKLVLIFLLVILVVLIYSLNTKYWKSNQNTNLVVNQGSDVLLVVFDPEFKKITTVKIPGDTLVEVPRNLGTMRLRNVWQLGQNEGVEGQLLADTITKNFHLPVAAWADRDAEHISSNNYLEILRSSVIPYKTNLSLGDRIRMAIYSFGVKDFKREEIKLEETSYLKKERLPDGNEGYVITTKVPKSLSILSSISQFSTNVIRVAIYDGTNTPGYAQEIGKIVESMGGKVVMINKVDFDGDCELMGKNEEINNVVSQVFGCEIKSSKIDGNYDLELRLGSGFSMRY